MTFENDVYDLNDNDVVACIHCTAEGHYQTYRKGEAYLAGPGHTPCDGNANYVCKRHLDSDAADTGQITLTHAKALARLDPEEQRAKVADLVAAGKDTTPHQRSRQQAAVMGERPRVKSRKQILEALEQAQGDYAAALRWVLGEEGGAAA